MRWALPLLICAACGAEPQSHAEVETAAPPAFAEDARLSVGDVSADRVELSWPAAQDADGYVVRIDSEEVAQLDADTRTYVAEGLEDGVEHKLEVLAVRGELRSAMLEERVHPPDVSSPAFAESAALTLTAEPRSGATNDTPRPLTVRWPSAEDNVGVVRYRVLRNGEEVAVVEGNEAVLEPAVLSETTGIEVIALDEAGHASAPLALRWTESAQARDESSARLAVEEAQAQVEQMLLGALGGDSGAFADVLAGGAIEGSPEDVLAGAQGVSVAHSGGGGVLRERRETGGAIGGLGGLARSSALPDPGSRGVVRIAPTVAVDASDLVTSAVDRQVRMRVRTVLGCYERELQTQPTLTGEARVRFAIETSGSTRVEGIEHALGDAMASCISSAFARMRFDPPPAERALFSTTLTFTPAN
jgi:hypothetical protein